MTDSYHYQIEPEPRAEEPKFRVGGVYRNFGGEIVVLARDEGDGFAEARHVNSDARQPACSSNRVSDGQSSMCVAFCRADDHYYNLIPGELVQRDGQWVAADSIGPFPSGATLKVAGDKIVGRVETQPAESLPDCPQCGYGPAYCNCKYLRAPLPHFNQRTEFDAFPDYVVFHEFEPVAPLYDSPTTDSAYPAIAGLLRG